MQSRVNTVITGHNRQRWVQSKWNEKRKTECEDVKLNKNSFNIPICFSSSTVFIDSASVLFLLRMTFWENANCIFRAGTHGWGISTKKLQTGTEHRTHGWPEQCLAQSTEGATLLSCDYCSQYFLLELLRVPQLSVHYRLINLTKLHETSPGIMPLKVNPHITLCGITSQRSRGRYDAQSANTPPASSWFLAWLILQPWRWRRHVLPKHRWTSAEWHDSPTHKIVLILVSSLWASR
jgi:hypothetical protein